MRERDKKRKTTYCCVPQCTNYERKGLSFHYFPGDKKNQENWKAILQIAKPPSRYMRVCSEHFQDSDYFPAIKNSKIRRLKKDILPTRNLPVRKRGNKRLRSDEKVKLNTRSNHGKIKTISTNEMAEMYNDKKEKEETNGEQSNLQECPSTLQEWRIALSQPLTENNFICEFHFKAEDVIKEDKINLSDGSVYRSPRIKYDLALGAIPISTIILAGESRQFAEMNEAESQIYETKTEDASLECRACLQILSADSVLYNIFESWTPPWDGMENNIAEDLAKIANIQILETDRHSKIMCETCCQLLLSACSFTAIVRKNDEILRQRCGEESNLNLSSERVWPKPIQVDKSLASSMFEDSMNVEIKQEVLSDDDNHYPTTNGSYDMSRDEPNLDIIKIEPEEIIQQQPFQIQVTVNGDVPPDHLNNKTSHLTNGNTDNGEELFETTIKAEPVSDVDDTDTIHSDLPLECMLCAKVFDTVSGLKAHVIVHHSYKSVKRKRLNSLSPEKTKSKYICAICRRTFTTSTDLMVHETCHNKSVCYGCNESFDTFAQLTTHRRTCKAIASKEVTKLKTLDDVLRSQSKEQTNELKCSLCDETFTDVYYMNIHKEIHHSNSDENDEVSNRTKVDNLDSDFNANNDV